MRSPKWCLGLAKSEKRKESVVCLHSLRRPPAKKPCSFPIGPALFSHQPQMNPLGKGLGVTKKALKLAEGKRGPWETAQVMSSHLVLSGAIYGDRSHRAPDLGPKLSNKDNMLSQESHRDHSMATKCDPDRRSSHFIRWKKKTHSRSAHPGLSSFCLGCFLMEALNYR